MISGPADYIPEIEVTVMDRRKAVPLSENEGIYVRNTQDGKVRLIKGPQTFMLGETEEYWNKILDPQVENLLHEQSGSKGMETQTLKRA